MRKSHLLGYLASVTVIWALAHGSVRAQSTEITLRPLSTVLGTDVPYIFPEKLIADPLGNLYILDTELSNIFFLNTKVNRLSPICTPRAPGSASDVSIDGSGNIWMLDSFDSKVSKLNRQCKVLTTFGLRRPSLRIQVNGYGEVATLTTAGETLFDLYNADGQLLHSFGRRTVYGNQVADTELNDGHLISDNSGGFYFSFNYPPLIQHYGRDGHLLDEFKPESEVNIGPPNVSFKMQGGRLQVSSSYQILVLDIAVDRRSRLYLLISGKNKAEALQQGSQRMFVMTNKGVALRKLSLEDPFHRFAIAGGALYALRNRRPLRLDKYLLS